MPITADQSECGNRTGSSLKDAERIHDSLVVGSWSSLMWANWYLEDADALGLMA